MPYLSQQADGTVVLRVHVQPKASRTRILGLHDGCLKLAILAPPVDGKANQEVERFIADLCGLPSRRVSIRSGAQGRRKLLLIKGPKEAEVRRLISEALGNGQ